MRKGNGGGKRETVSTTRIPTGCCAIVETAVFDDSCRLPADTCTCVRCKCAGLPHGDPLTGTMCFAKAGSASEDGHGLGSVSRWMRDLRTREPWARQVSPLQQVRFPCPGRRNVAPTRYGTVSWKRDLRTLKYRIIQSERPTRIWVGIPGKQAQATPCTKGGLIYNQPHPIPAGVYSHERRHL